VQYVLKTTGKVQLRQKLVEEGHHLISPHILDSRESNYCGDVLWNQKKELKEEEATAIACAEDVTLAEVQTVASLVLV